MNSELEMELKQRQLTFINENLSYCDVIINGTFRCIIFDSNQINEIMLPKICQKYEKDGVRLLFVNQKTCPSNLFLKVYNYSL